MAAGENGVNPTCLMPQESKGWKLVWGNEKPICCRLHQPGPCLTPWNGTTVSPLAPCHPAEAGFSSACGSYVHSSVRSVSLRIGCGMVQSQGLLWIMKKSFLFWLSGLKSLMGGLPLRFFFSFCFICLFIFFYHCALQLLVYMRTVEFVCTLINSPLKRFWIHHFLVSLLKLLRQRSFPGWRKSTHRPPPPPGWHKSLPPSARPGRSFVD